MITLEELQNKELDALLPLAKELGVKKPAADKEDLIYQILDIQAENYASNAPQREPRERRGRKTSQSADSEELSQPKKRGRKPKEQKPEQVEVSQDMTTEPQPKKRGRKSKKDIGEETENALQEAPRQSVAAEENVSPELPVEKRRRGRPRRNDVAEVTTPAPAVASVDEKKSETAAVAKKMMLARTVSSGLTLASRRKVVPTTTKTEEGGSNLEPDVKAEEIAAKTNVTVDVAAVEPQIVPVTVEVTKVSIPEAANDAEVLDEETAVSPIETSVDKKSDFVEFFPKKESNTRLPQRKADQEPRTAAQDRVDVPVSIQEPAVSSSHGMRKGKHVQAQAFDFNGLIECSGVLEVMPEGHGFLRSADFNYMPSPDDVYLTREQIRSAHIKTGDVVECTLRAPRENDKYFPMARLLRVNGRSPEFIRDRVPFEHLTPLFPDEKFDLTSGRTCNISTRVVDMFSPIGKGQRGLIVAPPKTGKTILLKDIANAIAENHPETYIMILLIDERPEEVTDMSRSVNAEVISSTFDEPADRHVRIANIVLEKAKRMVESGHDVVILLDSITRLARAYNTVTPTSSKILSGGVDANALQKPKRFFGAARNIEKGGSLTIIATALTETSSKMDEVIFEEFKGTGNMELQLDRKLSNKRIFPAVDIMASSTRRDDLLLRPETQNRMWILRRFLSDRNSIEAMEFIKDRMDRTSDNDELLRTMNE